MNTDKHNDKQLEQWMQEGGVENAPTGFANRLMNRIALETQAVMPKPLRFRSLWIGAAVVLLLVGILPLVVPSTASTLTYDLPDISTQAVNQLGELTSGLQWNPWYVVPGFMLLFFVIFDKVLRRRYQD